MPDRKRILVVDDMEANRSRIKTFLFMKSFEVDMAEDGLAAKKLFEAGKYDAVVSDIEMPNMNGFELLTWIRKASAAKSCPVVMLSSLDSPEVIDRCTKLGASAYVVKPFTKEKIEDALTKAGL